MATSQPPDQPSSSDLGTETTVVDTSIASRIASREGPQPSRVSRIVSQWSFRGSVVGFVLAVASLTLALYFLLTKTPAPAWEAAAVRLIPPFSLILSAAGAGLGLWDMLDVLRQAQVFEADDQGRQLALDDASALLSKLRPGCLSRIVIPAALALGLLALLVGLVPRPVTDTLVHFQIHSPTVSQSCSSTLTPFVIDLDNSASTASVSWSAAAVETIAGEAWATLAPEQGILGAGKHASVSVVPNATLCQYVTRLAPGAAPTAAGYAGYAGMALLGAHLPKTVNYHVKVTYSGTGKANTVHGSSTLGMTVDSGLGQPGTTAPMLVTTPAGPTDVNCFGSQVLYPTVTLGNTGGQRLTWTASTSNNTVALSKTFGTIQPQTLTQIQLKQAGPTTTATTLTITSNGGDVALRFTCIPPKPHLTVAQNQDVSETCSGSSAAPYQATLDNSNGNVPVAWTFDAPTGWASASPSSGTVGAGETATVLLTPNVCAAPGKSTTYRGTLRLSFPQGGSQPDITLSDIISGPAPFVQFDISPTTTSFDCTTGGHTAPRAQVVVSNTGNVNAGWSVSITDRTTGGSAVGSIWASASATSGTLAPGGTQVVTLTPSNDVCLASSTTYHANFSVTSGGQGAATFSYTVKTSF